MALVFLAGAAAFLGAAFTGDFLLETLDFATAFTGELVLDFYATTVGFFSTEAF